MPSHIKITLASLTILGGWGFSVIISFTWAKDEVKIEATRTKSKSIFFITNLVFY
jgi:hypothetical protein